MMTDEQAPRPRRRRSRRQRGFARAYVVRERTGENRAAERLGIDDTATNAELADLELLRPRTRGECRGGQRPCPWVACKHHLYLDVVTHTGSLKINFPGVEPTDLAETCSLDVAEAGGKTLDEIGELTNLTRERIRQVEVRGLLKLKAAAPERGIDPEDAQFAHPEGNQHPDTE